MPTPDSVDFSRSYWEKQINASLQAREEMPWGKSVSEKEFRHFVLPVRVNNEGLDDSRETLFEALRHRVQGMSMKEAALEVNHWCHEHVSYRPSDARTSSPLSTMKNTIGRCGEESTFTVAALRSVCIPARQVYVPRWAHTDDNHAWVEVWIADDNADTSTGSAQADNEKGHWYFMGACEPEAELNKGWFNWAASRAMLVHTNVFGDYDGPEELLTHNNCYTEVNCLKTYAPTKQLTVTVVDKDGKPIPDATVDFRLYNYAEFYPLLSRKTDSNGKASLTTGYGDLLIWVSLNDSTYTWKIAPAMTAPSRSSLAGSAFSAENSPEGELLESMVVELPSLAVESKNSSPRGGWEGALHAPVSALQEPDRSIVDTVSDNGRRLVYEDSIRTAYQKKTFWTKEKAIAEMEELGIDTVEWEIFTKARSNASTLRTFLEQAGDKDIALALLHSLTEKDLRDITLDVLWDSYFFTPAPSLPPRGKEACDWAQNVLCPRVSTEPLRPYKAFLRSVLPQMTAEEWVEWVNKNIRIDDSRNPKHIPMSVTGVYNNKVTDPHSSDIFLVAGARALGIPAYLDPATGEPIIQSPYPPMGEYNIPASEEISTKHSPSGGILSVSVPDDVLYYHRYSIAHIKDGRPVSLDYPDDDPTVTQKLKAGIEVPAGDYLITSGTRLKGGDILVHMQVINLKPGEKRCVPIVLRTSEHSIQSNLHLEDSEKKASATSVQSAQ